MYLVFGIKEVNEYECIVLKGKKIIIIVYFVKNLLFFWFLISVDFKRKVCIIMLYIFWK